MRSRFAPGNSINKFFVLFLFMSSSAFGLDEYVVTRLVGTVLVRQPWGCDWYLLQEGQRVAVESLIQNTTDAELSFIPAPHSVERLTAAHLSLVSPSLYRLTPNLMRRFNVRETSVNEEGDLGGRGTKTGKEIEQQFIPITLAWERQDGLSIFMSAVQDFAKGLRSEKSLAVDKVKSSVLMRNVVRRISITYPGEGTLIPSRQEKGEVIIAWEYEGDGPRPMIDLYVWPRDQERGLPTISSNAAAIPISLNRGGYFIQLATSDYTYQSKTLYIVVD